MTDQSLDQLELITTTLKELEASTGAELRSFEFIPHFVGGRLTRLAMILKYDPMLEETE